MINRKQLGAILASGLLVSGMAVAETIARTLQVGSTPDVHIINSVGEIQVRGVAGDSIDIEAELGDRAQRLEVSERGDRVTIEVIYKQGNSNRGSWRDDGTELVIAVPEGSSVEVDATSADIDVRAVRGRLSLSSVSGDVEAEVFNGDVEARSTSGDVTVAGHFEAGEASLESTSGDVNASALAGSLRARSTSGDVEIFESQLVRLSVGVVSGDIDVDGATLGDADIDAEAVSGDIEITLSRDFSGRVDVTTLNGSIDNCFGPKPQRTSKYGPGRELNFNQGEGKGRVEIQTVNGDIELCKQ